MLPFGLFTYGSVVNHRVADDVAATLEALECYDVVAGVSSPAQSIPDDYVSLGCKLSRS